jgi:choline dehydrogenase-like flavoprotein
MLTFDKDDIICRGNSRDYDSWAEAGNPGWSFAEVKQYFQKSAARTDLHGLGKVKDYVLEIWKSARSKGTVA